MKAWYGNWFIQKSFNNDRGRVSVDVLIPNSKTVKRIHFRSVTDERVNNLIDLLDCALSELSKKKGVANYEKRTTA